MGPAPQSALARLPVKEITVFKDGHVFVVHQGSMPTDASGHVQLDYLPAPVIGTFWPYSNEKNAVLKSVTAGKRRVEMEHTPLTLRDLVEANTGAEVMVSEEKSSYSAKILGFLKRSGDELEKTAPPGAGEMLPQKSNLLLLKTPDGTKAVNFESIKDIKFLGKLETTLREEEFRNLLTLHLDWNGGKAEKKAEVGMAYLQKGIRWIPGYRIELDGKGKAVVKLQATLINELTDLDNVSLNLVVGVPTFQFKDIIDPIALGQAVAQLTAHFDQQSQSAHAFSNAIMTQVATPISGRMRNAPNPVEGPAADLGPDVASAGKNEDLFVFTIKNVSLKKGQRLVLPICQDLLNYKDLYTLEIPYAPPPDVQAQINDQQRAELHRLFHAPKAVHKVRLENLGSQPLTTAPALILRDGRLLAQGLMTYTPRGSSVDLTITTAVNIKVKKTEKETKRIPNAAAYKGEQFVRIDVAGQITLANHCGTPVEVEIIRYVLGNVGAAHQDGKAEMVNVLEDDDYTSVGARPYWWGWYSWPHWWSHFNGVGRITWNQKIEPGKTVDLTYDWHYFWR